MKRKPGSKRYLTSTRGTKNRTKHEEGETRGRTLKARPFDDKVGFRKLPTQDLEALVIIILRIPRAESPNRNLC
jgi:hypothetical protein